MKTIFKKLRAIKKQDRNRILYVAIGIVSFAVIGAVLIRFSAATTSTPSLEAESANLSGSVDIVNDNDASGSKALRFGGEADANMTPTGLTTFTGGDSIAVRWHDIDASYGAVKYHVYRDGNQVAAVDSPVSYQGTYEQLGALYIDKNVEKGKTYTYKVAAEASGKVSQFSASVSATHPTNPAPLPNVTVKTTGDQAVDEYLSRALATLNTWYPKIVEHLVAGAYSAQDSITLQVADCGDPATSAATAGSIITICRSYVVNHSEQTYIVIHEATHAVQGWYSTSGLPQMLIEGLASWITDRAAGYEQPMPDETCDYNSGYACGSYFISWIMKTYNLPNFARDINVAAHNDGTQPSVIMKQQTGKTPAELWQEMTGRSVQ